MEQSSAETATQFFSQILENDCDSFDFVVDIATSVSDTEANRFHLREAMSKVHLVIDQELLKRKMLPKRDNHRRSRFLFFFEGMDRAKRESVPLHIHGFVGFAKKPTKWQFQFFQDEIEKQLRKRGLLAPSRTMSVHTQPVSQLNNLSRKVSYQMKQEGEIESMTTPIVFGKFKARSIFQ